MVAILFTQSGPGNTLNARPQLYVQVEDRKIEYLTITSDVTSIWLFNFFHLVVVGLVHVVYVVGARLGTDWINPSKTAVSILVFFEIWTVYFQECDTH